MTIDATTPGDPNDRRIEQNQTAAWAVSLGTTAERVQEAIDQVGNRACDVRVFLEGHPPCTGATGAAGAAPEPPSQSQPEQI